MSFEQIKDFFEDLALWQAVVAGLIVAIVVAFAALFSTAAPFIIGWFLVAPWLGAFQPEAWQSAKSALIVVFKAIVPAMIVSILVRALFAGSFSPVVFYLVAGSFMLLVLVIWRLIYTLVVAPLLNA